MKKLLLASMAFLSLANLASAQVASLSAPKLAPAEYAPSAPAISRAENTYEIRYCGEPAKWYPLMSDDSRIMLFIEVPAEVATQLAGNKVTEVTYSISFDNNATMETTRPGRICVWEGEKLMTTTDVDIYDSYLRDKGTQTTAFAADQQYVIKENTPFRFGVEYDGWGWDYPVCIDGKAAGRFAGRCRAYYEDDLEKDLEVGAATGSNLMMYAKTVGDKTSVNDYFFIGNVSASSTFSFPVLKQGEPIVSSLVCENWGDNAITSVEYEYAINGGQPKTGNLSINIPARTIEEVKIEINDYAMARNDISVSVKKINGIDVKGASTASFYALGDAEGFPRQFVVEKGTGTWCGWCPRGIVGFDYMYANYPDSFIGISLHVDDDMEVATYRPLLVKFFDIFPSCIVNRDPHYIIDPSADVLEAGYDIWSAQTSPVSVELEVNPTAVDDDVTCLLAKAKVSFVQNEENADYRVAFVTRESGLVGVQTNYYANSSEECGGWENLPESVVCWYYDVARDITSLYGDEGSLPKGKIEAGKTYEYSKVLPTTNVSSIGLSSVVALVIDGRTGVVLNAAQVEYDDYGERTGIEAISAEEADAPAVYYNMQGVRVMQPAHGNAYIKVQGGKASKIAY